MKTIHLDDSRGDADAMDRAFQLFLSPCTEQHESEDFLLIDASVDHQFVAVFKDMQRDGNLGEKNEIRQREKWDFHHVGNRDAKSLRKIIRTSLRPDEPDRPCSDGGRKTPRTRG